MRICEIHIDGFGLFADKHFEGLNSGMNIIYGPNEFGKSALLAFIRRMLFGFSGPASNANPHPTPGNGPHGGRLVCELDDGKRITIERRRGPREGTVTIETDSGQLRGQQELDVLLGHIPRAFYENVYAIGLDKLQTIRTLQDEEEVRSRVYGAGLGLGSVSLSDIENELKAQAECLYEPRGFLREMPVLYRRIRELGKDILGMQEALASYDDLQRGLGALKEEVSRLEGCIDSVGATQRSLESKAKLYPTYLELLSAEAELSGLEEVPDFSKDPAEELQQLKTALLTARQQLAESEEGLRGLETQRDALEYDEDLLGEESSVISLQRSSEEYAAAFEDIGPLEMERDALAGAVEKGAAQIGGAWTMERIRDFSLDHSQADKIRSYKESLQEVKRKADGCKNKLELYREETAARSLKVIAAPDFYRYAVYAVAGLGLVGAVAGFLLSNMVLTGFSVILLIIGTLVSLEMRKGDRMEETDRLDARLKEELQKAVSEYKRLATGWRELLRSIEFDEGLSPEAAFEVAKAVQDIQSDLSSLDRLDDRIKRKQATIDAVKEQHDRLVELLGDAEMNNDIGANIETLMQRLMRAREARSNREAIQQQINAQIARIESLRSAQEDREQEIRDYVSSLGATDENDLMVKYKQHVQRDELKARIGEHQRAIQSSTGGDKHYDEFMESLARTTPEEIQLELEKATAELEELKRDRDAKIRAIGEAEQQAEQIGSRNGLGEKQMEAETIRQQLHDLSRDWARSQIASLMLKKAISKYENTRQPEVIRAAQDIFSGITNDRYSSIIKPIDSDELQIRDTSGTNRRLTQVSRGTREQLYFALRLGLIEDYEARSESMPVIMDDVLVNFDDERARLAIEALGRFSKGRQIIVLTCHKSTLDMFRSAGASEVGVGQI